MERMLRYKALSEQVYELLHKEISEMSPGNNKLPSEDEIAKKYGISRSTVRDALTLLKMEGATTKVQGRGTFAHPSVFKIQNRVDLYSDFYVLLSRDHKNVSLDIDSIGMREKTAAFRNRMADPNPDEQVYRMDWKYSADGQISIYGRFEVPESVLKIIPEDGFYVQNLLEFGQKYLYNDTAYCAMDLKCGTNAVAAALFGIKKETPMQCWEEVIFDITDKPIGFCCFYMHPENLVMSIVTHFDENGK